MSIRSQRFDELLSRLVRVPKAEIDEAEKKDAKRRKARKTHRAYAKAGQIAAQPQK